MRSERIKSINDMKRSRKSNRVTWASGLNLCQVRQFLAEDSPSKVGDLQNDLPPGFEADQYLHPGKDVSFRIPRIVWKCPPKVLMDSNWQVAAGEESQEAELQKFREMRTLEAVFPHCAAIPSSPSVSLNAKEECYDDSLTPVIPQTAEEETAADIPSELSPAVLQDPIPSGTCNTPTLQPPAGNKPKLGALPDVGADIILATSVAVDALKKSMDRNSIDTELLVKIFSDPKIIEDLMKGSLSPGFTTIIPTTNIPRSIPPPCPIPPTLPTPAPAIVDRSCGFQCQTVSKPESRYALSVSLPENLHHTKNDVQQTIARMPPQLDTRGSVSSPPTDILDKMAHKPDQAHSAGITAHKPDQVHSVGNMDAWPILPTGSGIGMMTVQPELGSALKNNTAAMKLNTPTDLNYFKNLIKEHGTQKKLANRNGNYKGAYSNNHVQNLEYGQNVESKAVRSKFQKPCMYFRAPKGCRNGSNCPYQHDLSIKFHNGGPLDLPVAKRMRIGSAMTTGTAF